MPKAIALSKPDEMTSVFARERLRDEVRAFVAEAIDVGFAELGADRVAIAEEAVDRFFARFPERPVRDNKGGLAFAGSLALYVAARLLAPDFIVESGVHKGHTTWVLREACPAADIRSFDIDLSNVLYRDPSGALCGYDWSEHDISVENPERALAFFDDHVSHARRIGEAYRRGFRWLILDDNMPAWNLYATGVPPVPTVAMLLDPSIRPGQEFRWRRHGKEHSFIMTPEEIGDAPDLIEFARKLPDVSHLTRGGRVNDLTLVRLVARS